MKRKLFVESPSFGFGPISTSINIAREWQNEFDIYFVSSGKALEFLRKSSDYRYIDIDTRDESQFTEIYNYASVNDLFISNTNVEFSVFAIERYPRVCIIDTLYWMWNALPTIYEQHPYFIQQVYYGPYRKSYARKKICAPIINYNLWTAPKKEGIAETALITFGGMEEPGNTEYIRRGSLQLIERLLKELSKYSIKHVDIIGGLFYDEERINTYGIDITIRGIVDPVNMRELVDNSRYIFASPGLTGLYEMFNISCPVFVLPGFNVSQIYQVFSLSRSAQYPYCAIWESCDEMISVFDRSSEIEGIEYIRSCFDNKIDVSELDIGSNIHKYINEVNSNIACKYLLPLKHRLFSHPPVNILLNSFLGRYVGE